MKKHILRFLAYLGAGLALLALILAGRELFFDREAADADTFIVEISPEDVQTILVHVDYSLRYLDREKWGGDKIDKFLELLNGEYGYCETINVPKTDGGSPFILVELLDKNYNTITEYRFQKKADSTIIAINEVDRDFKLYKRVDEDIPWSKTWMILSCATNLKQRPTPVQADS